MPQTFTTNNFIQDNRGLYLYALRCGTKRHRAEKSYNFLVRCQNSNTLPFFTFIKKDIVQRCRLSPHQIYNIRTDHLNHEIATQLHRLQYNRHKYTDSLNQIKNVCSFSDRLSNNVVNYINSQIRKNESKTDTRRNRKFNLLKQKHTSKAETITIFNHSDITIPDTVKSALEYGYELAVGGKPRSFNILSSFDQLFRKWQKYARSQQISPFIILDVRSQMYFHARQLCNCFNINRRVKILDDFFNLFPELIIMKVDKSKNVVITSTDNYKAKLTSLLSDSSKFLPIKNNPLAKDLKLFRKLLSTLKMYLNKFTFLRMLPNEQYKKGHGYLKLHKDGFPLRPIVSSTNSLTCGAESFLKKIFGPLVKRCTKVVNSTKQFKERFIAQKQGYDPTIHTVISWDAVSLYTNVNVERVIIYICDLIYESPNEFFQ